jgi:hypothetical protein
MVRFGLYVCIWSIFESMLCWDSQKTFRGSKTVRWGGAGHGSKWMLSPEVMLEASFVLLNARSAMEGQRKADKFGTSKNLKNV